MVWQSLLRILRISAAHKTTSGDTPGARGHHHCGSLTLRLAVSCVIWCTHTGQWTRKINFPNTRIISGLVSVVMTVISAQPCLQPSGGFSQFNIIPSSGYRRWRRITSGLVIWYPLRHSDTMESDRETFSWNRTLSGNYVSLERSRLKSHSRASFANGTFASCFSHTKLILDYFAIDNLIISLPFASDLPCAGNILVSCLTLHALFKTNFTFSFLS